MCPMLRRMGEIHLELPVEHIKEVPLRVELVDGGGAGRISTPSVKLNLLPSVSPALREALKSVTEISLTSINLGDVDTTKGMEVSVELSCRTI